jgi:mRNA-degrading endonuclease RelE of RelBE toxin-antitoxin system
MINKVYLTPSVNEALHSLDLTADQLQSLDKVMNALAQGSLLESRIVLTDDTSSGGLRELNQGGLRILFRHDPQSNIVVIADIRPKFLAMVPKNQTEDQLAAAS